MFLYCCLLKFGFILLKLFCVVEICLNDLVKVDGEVVILEVLKVVNVIIKDILFVKVILVGKIEKVVKVKGLGVIKGVKVVIEVVGGFIEE